MKIKFTHCIELDDEKITKLVDKFEERLNEVIFEIEDEQMQEVMDLIGGVFPIVEDDEIMELAFDLIMEVREKIWYRTMKRYNLRHGK